MRRTLGVGGATGIAIVASLALAGVADAHTPTFSTGCLDNGQAVLNAQLANYTQPQKSSEHNTITISYTPNGGSAQSVLAVTDFNQSYPKTQFPVDGTTAGTFSATITAWDDPNGDHSVAKVGQGAAWDGTFTLKTTECKQPSGTTTTPPPTTTTPPPPAGTTSNGPTPTSVAAVAPVSDKTPPTAKPALAYTGVSTELPLIIAGALIIIGAAALIGMRIMKRRRAES